VPASLLLEDKLHLWLESSRFVKARPSQARPGQAKPGQARPSQAKPIKQEIVPLTYIEYYKNDLKGTLHSQMKFIVLLIKY